MTQQAFSNFHFGSKRAEAMLRALPVVSNEGTYGKKQTSEEDSGNVSPVAEECDSVTSDIPTTRTSPPLVLSAQDSKVSTDFQDMLRQWENNGLYGGGHLEFFTWAAAVLSDA